RRDLTLDTRVVEEAVDAAMRVERRLDIGLDVARERDVGGDEPRIAAVAPNCAADLLARSGIAVDQNQPRTRPSEGLRRCPADAARRTGDDDHLAGEIHRRLLNRGWRSAARPPGRA